MSNETKDARERSLRQMLHDRREAMEGDLRTRMRDARVDRAEEVCDEVDTSDSAMQEGIGFALLQLKAETLARLDEALVRLDAGEFGFCFECHEEIAATRLRALPFAVRCTKCEEQREQRQVRERQLAQRRSGLSLFSEVVGS